MKRRIIALVLALILIAPAALADVDLSGMTFEELLELQRQVTAAIWASDGWQEVTVPTGVYEIGVDIPVGYWTIRAVEGNSCFVEWCGRLNSTGTESEFGYSYDYEGIETETDKYYEPGDPLSVSWNLTGGYIRVVGGSAIFTPFTGHNLGFK